MPLILFAVLIVFVLAFLIFLSIMFFARRAGRKLFKEYRRASLPRSITTSLRESWQYGRLIIQTAQQYPPGPMRDRLNLTIKPVDEWLTNLARLERGLEKLYSQRNLSREVRQTKFEIDDLRRQLLVATDKEAVFLRELMKSKEQHLAALKELQLFQTQAELKIRKIASDLGATHAEMLLIIARGDFNENRFRRLDENLQEHVGGMRDMLAAMDELGYTSAVN